MKPSEWIIARGKELEGADDSLEGYAFYLIQAILDYLDEVEEQNK